MHLVITLDAAGLALSAVAGTEKALDQPKEFNPAIAVLWARSPAVGIVVVRNVLLAQVPAVLRVDVHATAARAGSLVMVIGRRVGIPRASSALLGARSVSPLRMLAVWQNWQSPRGGPS